MIAAVRPVPATVVLGLGTVVSHGFGLSLIPAMLPRISDDLGVGYGVLGSVTAAGLLAYSLGALAAGRVVDRVPSRELLVGTYLTAGIGLLVAGAATSPVTLTVGAVILGVSAPLSWAATLHVAGATVVLSSRAAVMSGASSGAALGVLINGILIQTSADLHSWRVSFLVAAALALLPIVGSLLLFREAVPPPEHTAGATARAGFRAIARTPAGRLVVGAAIVGGMAGFPFSVFLTATAIDEMQVSAWSAALLWWVIGGLGTLAGPLFGRYGDRASPVAALAAGAVLYAVSLVLLVATWNYAGLLAAAVGFAAMEYPIWGLVGALSNRHFGSAMAVRAISLGLIGAAVGGAAANAGAGAWIDATASFRLPVAVIAVAMVLVSGWYVTIYRRGEEQRTVPLAYDH